MYAFKPFKWVEIHPKGTLNPQGRSGHRIIYFNQAIYAFGGYNPNVTLEENDDELWEINQPMFKELWKFNLDSCRWSKIRLKGEAPTMLASHTAQFMMIAERPKLLVSEFFGKNFVKIAKNHANFVFQVYGGTALPFGQVMSIKIHVCDLWNYNWEVIEGTNQLPKALYGQAATVQDEDFYVIGGTSGLRYFMDVHHLNIHQQKWNLLCSGTEGVEFINNLPDQPSPR